MKDAKQGGGYESLSLTWSRAAQDLPFHFFQKSG